MVWQNKILKMNKFCNFDEKKNECEDQGKLARENEPSILRYRCNIKHLESSRDYYPLMLASIVTVSCRFY